MGYDAYVNIKKKYTKSAIEKILIMMDYKKREEVFYCGNDDEYKLFTGYMFGYVRKMNRKGYIG